jgi:hypothetical protein
MIRVSVFSNDLMPQGGGQGLIYIGRSLQREPLDQTNLKNGKNGSRVVAMLSLLKSTQAFKQQFSSGLE